MTTRVTEGARRERLPPSFLASRVSRLAASPLNARARVHSPYQIWRKGETARSLYIICHSSQLPLLKKNRESKIMYNETQSSYNQPLYNEKTTVVGITFPLLPVPDADLEIRGGRSSRSLHKGGQSPKKIFSAPRTSVCLKIRAPHPRAPPLDPPLTTHKTDILLWAKRKLVNRIETRRIFLTLNEKKDTQTNEKG